MFNKEELNNLSALLLRVDLKGNEALAVVLLQQKIKGLIEKEVLPVEDKEEEPKEK